MCHVHQWRERDMPHMAADELTTRRPASEWQITKEKTSRRGSEIWSAIAWCPRKPQFPMNSDRCSWILACQCGTAASDWGCYYGQSTLYRLRNSLNAECAFHIGLLEYLRIRRVEYGLFHPSNKGCICIVWWWVTIIILTWSFALQWHDRSSCLWCSEKCHFYSWNRDFTSVKQKTWNPEIWIKNSQYIAMVWKNRGNLGLDLSCHQYLNVWLYLSVISQMHSL